MTISMIVLAASYLLEVVLFIVQPWFSRKNVLFGVVFGDESVWGRKETKQIRARYLAESAGVFIVVSAAALLYFLFSEYNGMNLVCAFLFAVFADMLAGTVVFVFANRRTKRYKLQAVDEFLVKNKVVIETGIQEKTTVLSPAFALLLLPLLLATVLVAVFGYSLMPETIPIHYSFTAADAWANKSWGAVLFPVLGDAFVAAVLAVSFLFSRRAPASVRGNPDAAPGAYRFRNRLSLLLIFFGMISEVNFLIMEIGDLTQLSILMLTIPEVIMLGIGVLIFVIYQYAVREKKPSGAILDDDAKWVLGLFYYNPSDPSSFVEKRVGIGFTPNYAKPAGWIFTFGILAVVVVILIVSFIAK